MAEPVNKDVTLTVGTGANTVPNTIKDEKTWDEDWAKTFNKNFTNASGKVTIEGQNSDKITISKDITRVLLKEDPPTFQEKNSPNV